MNLQNTKKKRHKDSIEKTKVDDKNKIKTLY